VGKRCTATAAAAAAAEADNSQPSYFDDACNGQARCHDDRPTDQPTERQSSAVDG